MSVSTRGIIGGSTVAAVAAAGAVPAPGLLPRLRSCETEPGLPGCEVTLVDRPEALRQVRQALSAAKQTTVDLSGFEDALQGIAARWPRPRGPTCRALAVRLPLRARPHAARRGGRRGVCPSLVLLPERGLPACLERARAGAGHLSGASARRASQAASVVPIAASWLAKVSIDACRATVLRVLSTASHVRRSGFSREVPPLSVAAMTGRSTHFTPGQLPSVSDKVVRLQARRAQSHSLREMAEWRHPIAS